MTGKLGLGWLPLILVSTLGLCGAPTLPIWLAGATERFQLTAIQSGMLASLELASVAAASIASAALATSGRNRAGLWLVLALVLSISGNLGSFLAADVASLTATRILVGLSGGLMLAEITRRAAQLPDPHRVFAMQQFGLVLFTSVFFPTVPHAIAALGPSAPFLFNVTLGVLTLASLVWLPSPGAGAAADAATPRPESAEPSVQGASTAIAMTFVAIALSFMAQGSLWTYIAMAARNSGLEMETLGGILALGAILNAMAPLAAGRLGLRWGHAAPLLLGYTVQALSILLVALGLGPSWFAVGAIGLNLALLFLTPFLLGTLAALDASGRSASAGPAFFMIGGAIGPIVGGLVIGSGGFALLGVIGALAAVCALGLSLTAGSRIAAPAGRPGPAILAGGD